MGKRSNRTRSATRVTLPGRLTRFLLRPIRSGVPRCRPPQRAILPPPKTGLLLPGPPSGSGLPGPSGPGLGPGTSATPPIPDSSVPGVEILEQYEDTRRLSDPIVTLGVAETQFAATTRDDAPVSGPARSTLGLDVAGYAAYLGGLFGSVGRVRVACVVGSLHHGKSTFLDLFVPACVTAKLAGLGPGSASALGVRGAEARRRRLTDRLLSERQRGISLRCSGVSCAVAGLSGATYVVQLLDTPGAPGLIGCVASALELVDGVVCCVDAVEGVSRYLERVPSPCG